MTPRGIEFGYEGPPSWIDYNGRIAKNSLKDWNRLRNSSQDILEGVVTLYLAGLGAGAKKGAARSGGQSAPTPAASITKLRTVSAETITETQEFAATVKAQSAAAKTRPPTAATLAKDTRTGIVYTGTSGKGHSIDEATYMMRMRREALEALREQGAALVALA